MPSSTETAFARLRARYQATMVEARQRVEQGRAMAADAERMIHRLQGALTALDEVEAEMTEGEEQT